MARKSASIAGSGRRSSDGRDAKALCYSLVRLYERRSEVETLSRDTDFVNLRESRHIPVVKCAS